MGNSAPSKTFLQYTFLTLYHVSVFPSSHDTLIRNGLLTMVLSPWFKDFSLGDDVVQNGCGVIINICKDAKTQFNVSDIEKMRIMQQFVKNNRPNLENVTAIMEVMLLYFVFLGFIFFQKLKIKRRENENEITKNKHTKKI